MAVHGTRRGESVSWDYEGLLQLLSSLARERSGLPVRRQGFLRGHYFHHGAHSISCTTDTFSPFASRLNVALKTVETHRTELMERLGIHGVASLVRYAIQVGLVRPET